MSVGVAKARAKTVAKPAAQSTPPNSPAGLAVLQRVIKDKLVPRPPTGGRPMQSPPGQLRSPRPVGAARGIGLLWAIEFVADKTTKEPSPADKTYSARVADACLRRGL